MKWTPEHGTNNVHLVLNVKLLEIETLHVVILGSCSMQKYLLIVTTKNMSGKSTKMSLIYQSKLITL